MTETSNKFLKCEPYKNMTIVNNFFSNILRFLLLNRVQGRFIPEILINRRSLYEMRKIYFAISFPSFIQIMTPLYDD